MLLVLRGCSFAVVLSFRDNLYCVLAVHDFIFSSNLNNLLAFVVAKQDPKRRRKWFKFSFVSCTR